MTDYRPHEIQYNRATLTAVIAVAENFIAPMKLPSLKNQLLVSMPQLSNPNFHQTVSLICQHDAHGAIGVVVNRLTDHRLGDIFDQLSLPVSSLDHTDQPVFEGGPVSPELGLVIHAGKTPGGGDKGNPRWESTMEIGGGLWLTSSRDILGAIAGGNGPPNAMMVLGYSGWGPGQLEQELRQNSWFHAPADHSIIFNTQVAQKWHQAAKLLGVDYTQFSGEVGHA